MPHFKPETKTNQLTSGEQILALLIAFCLLFSFFFHYLSGEKPQKRQKIKPTDRKAIPKKDLPKRYGVDKKTFLKWVRFFVAPSSAEFDAYKSARLLSESQCTQIIEALGEPGEFPMMTKGEMVTQSESTFRALREFVQRFGNRYGMDATVYASLQKFPPSVAKRLMADFN